MRLAVRSAVLVALGCAAGCGEADTDPVQAYRAYLGALAKPDVTAAWNALSRSTHEAFEAAARASQQSQPNPLLRATSAPPGTRFESGAALFGACVTDGFPSHVPYLTPSTVDRVKIQVERRDESNTVLKVLTPVGTEAVTMVREDGHWKTALTF